MMCPRSNPKWLRVGEIEDAVRGKLRCRGLPAVDVQPQLPPLAYGRQVRPAAADVVAVADDLPGLDRVDSSESALGIHVDGAAST